MGSKYFSFWISANNASSCVHNTGERADQFDHFLLSAGLLAHERISLPLSIIMQEIFNFSINMTFHTYFLDTKAWRAQGQSFRGRPEF